MDQTEIVQKLRIWWYRRQWSCGRVEGAPLLVAPVVLAGAGSIRFGAQVTLGWRQSPWFLSGYTYIEARHEHSRVEVDEQTHLNNGIVIISEGPGISIGKRCLIGPGVHIYDSDFHALEAAGRASKEPRRALVVVEDDVFIGSGAMILKGVRLGAGCVVGAGAVVTTDVAAGLIVAGSPARVLRH